MGRWIDSNMLMVESGRWVYIILSTFCMSEDFFLVKCSYKFKKKIDELIMVFMVCELYMHGSTHTHMMK